MRPFFWVQTFFIISASSKASHGLWTIRQHVWYCFRRWPSTRRRIHRSCLMALVFLYQASHPLYIIFYANVKNLIFQSSTRSVLNRRYRLHPQVTCQGRSTKSSIHQRTYITVRPHRRFDSRPSHRLCSSRHSMGRFDLSLERLAHYRFIRWVWGSHNYFHLQPI